MRKSKNLQKLISLLVVALRHKIGSIVNEDEIYAQKYAKDAEVLFNEAKKISIKENWNHYDKIELKETLKKKFLNSQLFRHYEIEKNNLLIIPKRKNNYHKSKLIS